jgi:hypothetical protein
VERVASYHLSVHPNVSRGKGQSLVRTAAYNDRTRLVDERTGEVWDYSHLGAALASGMYPPKGAPDWAHDLGQLVNEVERFEKRSDAQLAMNLDIALPHEQTLEQNRRLMQDFVHEQFQRKGYAAHFAIHPPDRDGDDRNIHAHVLVTLRKIDENGFARTKAEQQERYRNRGEFVEGLRDAWEKLANRHLERNGYDARIDRRSLEDQGIRRRLVRRSITPPTSSRRPRRRPRNRPSRCAARPRNSANRTRPPRPSGRRTRGCRNCLSRSGATNSRRATTAGRADGLTAITTATATTITAEGASDRVEPPRIEAIRRRQNREPPSARLSWRGVARVVVTRARAVWMIHQPARPLSRRRAAFTFWPRL